MKELLIKMFHGWVLYEQSYNGERYTRDATECMIEACGGDAQEGYLLYLFGYWSNDITSAAAHYGVGLHRDNDTGVLSVVDVPVAPSPAHFWHENAWHSPEED